MIKRSIKYLVLIVFSLSLLLVGCGDDEKSKVDDFTHVANLIEIPNEIFEDLDLKNSYYLDNQNYSVSYEMDSEALSSEGEIYPDLEEDLSVNISVIITKGSESKRFDLGKHKVMSMKNIVNAAVDSIEIPSVVNNDLNFRSSIGKVKVRWTSSNIDAIGRNGACYYVNDDTPVKLSATFSIRTSDDSYQVDKEYNVTVKKWDASRRYDLVMDEIKIPDSTIYDLNLPRKLKYDVNCKWESSDINTISNFGRVNRSSEDKNVSLKLLLWCSDSDVEKKITYNVKVEKQNVVEGEMNFDKHILVDRANKLNIANMNGLVYNGEKVVLKDDSLSGTYESEVFNTLDFTRVVGSFSCITNTLATCELAISVKVNGVWSKYFSYGEFGLGRNNLYYNQNDTYAYMDTDMIEPNRGLVGNGVKYKVTLKRDKLETKSPELSLVALALFIKDYNYAVDTSDLPDSVDWDLPKHYQHDVPGIGSVICSATTTTMLLNFAGYSFTDKGYQYEHQYMANMVADKGHNNPTYGNWSYNMMTAGAFGINAYVGKMYSWDEIKYYLAHNGPLGVSIGGNFGIYSTDGHLLVLRGYRVENGQTTVICNDPNVKGVYYEVSLEIFLRCWGSVVYIMEFENVKDRVKDLY